MTDANTTADTTRKAKLHQSAINLIVEHKRAHEKQLHKMTEEGYAPGRDPVTLRWLVEECISLQASADYLRAAES